MPFTPKTVYKKDVRTGEATIDALAADENFKLQAANVAALERNVSNISSKVTVNSTSSGGLSSSAINKYGTVDWVADQSHNNNGITGVRDATFQAGTLNLRLAYVSGAWKFTQEAPST